METMQQNRTFEDIIKEACNAHTKQVSDLMTRVNSWKDRFETLLKQKNSYKAEILKLRQENYEYVQESRKLQEQLNTGTSRDNIKCMSCDSLTRSMETVEQAYQHSLQEKDKIIAFLDARLSEYSNGKSLIGNTSESFITPNKPSGSSDKVNKKSRPSTGKKQSPDSTCNTDLATVDGASPDHRSSQSLNKTGKLRLSKQNKKRKNRYSEDPSPEQKRSKLPKNDPNSKKGDANKLDKKSSKMSKSQESLKTSIQSEVFVPETLDFYQGCSEDEGTTCGKNTKSGSDNTDKKNTIPETVAMEICDILGSSSGHDTDSQDDTVKEKKSYSLYAMLESPPSGIDNSDDDENDKHDYVSHKTLNLSGTSVKNGSESSDEEVLTVKEKKINAEKDRKLCDVGNKSNDKNPDKSSNKLLHAHRHSESNSQIFRSKPAQPCPNSQTEVEKGDGNCGLVSQVVGTSSKFSMCAEDVESPSVFKDLSRKSKHVDKFQSLSDSEPESPLLLKMGASSSQEFTKSGNNPFGQLVRGQTFPPTGKSSKNLSLGDLLKGKDCVDLDEEESDNGLEKESACSPLVIRRRTRNSQSKQSGSQEIKSSDPEVSRSQEMTLSESRMSRSQEMKSSNKPEEVDRSSKSRSSINSSSNKSALPKTFKNQTNSRTSEELGVCEGRVLRQTTLSQAFRNSPQKSRSRSSSDVPKRESQEARDIQKAIELSLKENECAIENNHDGSSSVKEKENTPPFKKPSTPKKGRLLTPHSKSPRRNLNRKYKQEVIDLDETVSPSSLRSHGTHKAGRKIQGQVDHKGQGQIDYPGSPSDLRFNGSIDPAIELSKLCEDSEPLNDRGSHDDHLDGNYGEPSAIFISPESDVAPLHDFTLTDLQNDKHRGVLTSTCIMDDSQSIPSSTTSVKFGPGIKRNLRSVEDYSEDIDLNCSQNEEEDNQTVHSSFDRIPRKKELEFAHVEVVRKQDERRKLKGHHCKECHEYYDGMDLNEEEKKERMQACSKHRAKFGAPDTPEHFWSIHFLNTQDLEDKGYVHQKEKTKPSNYRRRFGLRKIFKSKTEEEKTPKQSPQKDVDVSDIDI